MFVGREKELQLLKDTSQLNKASLIVCRGRRRIGKSTLIQKFADQNKINLLEFQGLPPEKNITYKDQLNNFGEQLSEQTSFPKLTLDNWTIAFDFLERQISKKKMIIFLDEISWMAYGDRTFAGKLKIAWDTKLKKHSKLIVVVCGSVSSWIDKNIVNSTGFMGRVSLTIDLQELSLKESHQFWGKRKKKISSHEKLKILSLTGGVPRYLEEIDYSKSAEKNIKHLCFNKNGILFSEFDKIFNDIFFRRSPIYKQIILSLSNGPKSLNEICKTIKNHPNGVMSEYLSDLEMSGFISKNYRWNIKSGKVALKKHIFHLKDNYLRFYLKYIEPNHDKIKKGLFEDFDLNSLPSYDAIMGLQFENLVLNNIKQVISKLSININNIVNAGSFSQTKTKEHEACQIDLLIQTKRTLFICEIKFQKNVRFKVIKEMEEKIKNLKTQKTISIRPVLIYEGDLDQRIITEEFFDRIIPFGELLDV